MERCPLCPGKNKCIGPSGPRTSKILFVGEAPGKQEDGKGQVFVGKTGDELDRGYLPLAHLRRENVRIINSIACLPDKPDGKISKSNRKDMELLYSCASTHLFPEIWAGNYELIVAMGAFACHTLDPSIDLDLHHGFPMATSWGIVFPMFHPAGGIHEPKKMLLLRNDWVRLRRYLKGELKLPIDEFAGKEEYLVVNTPDDLRDTLAYAQEYPLACDTEITRKGDPYCLTYSVCPGTGYLIKADNGPVLSLFQKFLDEWKAPILFHNWLFDGRVVRGMGLRYPESRIVDTMVRSFHLGNLPQGLKALAWRQLGMTMQDFDDLVSPYSKPLSTAYIRDAMEYDWPKPDPELKRGDDGQFKLYQPQGMRSKFKRFLSDLQKNPEKDVFTAWDNWEDQHAAIEEMAGEFPGKCITHVPFENVIHYASRDADATLRLYHVQEKMIRNVRRTSQESWGL